MAVTHADLAPGRKSNELGRKTGLFVMVLSILLGLCCFVLCLVAEATRYEVTWMASSDDGEKNTDECKYNSNGRTPLLYAAGAFVGLAAIVVLAHVYLLVVVSKSPQPEFMYYDPDFDPSKILTWQAGFFFVSTWHVNDEKFFFAVGETLLLIGLGIESGHLKNWSTPRPSCLIVNQGIFSVAGVFSLITVLIVVGFYITILRVYRLMHEHENVRREVAAAASLRRLTRTALIEDAEVRENRNIRTFVENFAGFSKECDLV